MQLKRFRKIENSFEKIYKPVKFPIGKAVIEGRSYELKGVTYHAGDPISGLYTATVQFKERQSFWLASAFWRNVLDLPDFVYLEVYSVERYD